MSTRKKRIKPVEEATSFILLSKDKPGIEGKYIDSEKGRRQQIISHQLISLYFSFTYTHKK